MPRSSHSTYLESLSPIGWSLGWVSSEKGIRRSDGGFVPFLPSYIVLLDESFCVLVPNCIPDIACRRLHDCSIVDARIASYVFLKNTQVIRQLTLFLGWLIKVGREAEAKAILQRLRAVDTPSHTSSLTSDETGVNENSAAEVEFDQIVQVVQLEKNHSNRNGYWSMFWGTGSYPDTMSISLNTNRNSEISLDIGSGDLHIARRVQLSVWLQIMQEWVLVSSIYTDFSLISRALNFHSLRWVGIAAITVYAPTIFAAAGYGARKAQWLSGLNNVRPLTRSPRNTFPSTQMLP